VGRALPAAVGLAEGVALPEGEGDGLGLADGLALAFGLAEGLALALGLVVGELEALGEALPSGKGDSSSVAGLPLGLVEAAGEGLFLGLVLVLVGVVPSHANIVRRLKNRTARAPLITLSRMPLPP
jgi:hypothetical protein